MIDVTFSKKSVELIERSEKIELENIDEKRLIILINYFISENKIRKISSNDSVSIVEADEIILFGLLYAGGKGNKRIELKDIDG